MRLTPSAVVCVAWTAFAGGACARPAASAWPVPALNDAQGLLLHLRSAAGDQLVALDRAAAPPTLPFADDLEGPVEATALGLALPLAAYAIAPGPQRLVSPAEGRPWPPFVSAARRDLEGDWRVGLGLDDTVLAGTAIDAAPLCPPVVAEPWPLPFGNPNDLVAIDRDRALVATDAGLWSIGARPWTLTAQPLPDGAPIRAMWLGADGALVAGTAVTSEVYFGRWTGSTVAWGEHHGLAAGAALVAVTGASGGPAYAVTTDGQVLREQAGPARSERLFEFRRLARNSGGGIALRGPEALVAYSNVEAGRIAFLESSGVRAASVFPGPLNVLVSVDGFGVVAGSALGFAVLGPGAGDFAPLGPAPLEPQALVKTRDGGVAFGTNGRVVRYDRRSGHSCPSQGIAPGEFRLAVALDDETALALETPPAPGEPMTAWRLQVPKLAF